MANDLIEFGQGAVSQAFAWADPNEESLSDGIGGSFGIIGYRGGKWSLRYRGQTFMFTREDGTPSPWLHLVILAQARTKSKSFYPKYIEGSDDPPKCASIDSVTPDAGVPEPQATACGICPRNILFINPETNKKTTECKDHKRLSVLLLASETKRMLGEPLLEPVFLRVPGASLQNLSLMGDAAAKMGKAFCTFVTRVSFDQTTTYPKMIFKGVQMLPDSMADLIKELRFSPTTDRILGISGARGALAAPPRQQAIPASGGIDTGFEQAQRPAQPQGQPQTLELQANPPQPAPQRAPLQAPPANSATTAAEQPTVSLEGFGPAQTASPSRVAGPAPSNPVGNATAEQRVATVAAQQNAVVDLGEPEEADDEMAARIAALMPK